MANAEDHGSEDQRTGSGDPRWPARQDAAFGRETFMADLDRLLAAESQGLSPSAQASIWCSLSSTLSAHLARDPRFGRTREPAPAPAGPHHGGLAHWQEVLAKEMLAAHLGSRLPVSRMAAACQLSRSHFSLAFKRSTGSTPHRWLMLLRIDRAKQLLLRSPLSISAIAGECGFADQSHLTRVFNALVGTAPGHWRREHRCETSPD